MRPNASTAQEMIRFADSQSGHAVGIRDRGPALRADFVDDLLCRAGIPAFAFDCGAEVIDEHFRAGGRHRMGEIAADAAARAGDDDALILKGLQSRKPGYFLSARRRSAGHSSGPQRRRVFGS